jgi:hypothetical protein
VLNIPEGMYEVTYSVYVITQHNFEILKGALPQKSSHVMFLSILGESMKNVAIYLKLNLKLVIMSPTPCM